MLKLIISVLNVEQITSLVLRELVEQRAKMISTLFLSFTPTFLNVHWIAIKSQCRITDNECNELKNV